jgi:hypothetical protein
MTGTYSAEDSAAGGIGGLWWLACAVLSCLFLTSTVILVIVLVRRNRKGS